MGEVKIQEVERRPWWFSGGGRGRVRATRGMTTEKTLEIRSLSSSFLFRTNEGKFNRRKLEPDDYEGLASEHEPAAAS